jgi:hypothetical protein
MLTLVIASLQIHFHFIRLKLHEVSLYLDFQPEEFTPPYLMRLRPLQPNSRVEISPPHIEALMVCVQSSHALLDAFLSMNTLTLRCIPVIAYTRMFYAIVVLTKLALGAHSPDSSIGAVLDFAGLKTTFYLNVVTNALQIAVGPEAFIVPSIFLSIVVKLTAWYQRQHSIPHTDRAADELFEPMAYLSTKEEAKGPAKPTAVPLEVSPVDETKTPMPFDSDIQSFDFGRSSGDTGHPPGTSSWPSAVYPLETSTDMYNLALHHDQSQTYGVESGQNTQDNIPWSQQTMDFGFYSNMMGQTFEDSFVSFPSESGRRYGS